VDVMKNEIGMYALYWDPDVYTKDFPSHIKKVRSLGFDYYEVGARYFLEMSRYERLYIRDLCKDIGIKLAFSGGPHAEGNLLSDDSTVRKQNIEYMKRVLETISELGGNIICGLTHCKWLDKPPKDINAELKKRLWDRSVDGVRQIIKVAEDLNILYTFEIVSRFDHFLTNCVAEGVAYCKQVDSPMIKMHLDAFHMNIEEGNIYEAFLAAKDYIGYYHISECNRQLPGHPENSHQPWESIFTGLRDSNYEGPIVIEPFVRMGGERGYNCCIWRELDNNFTDSQMDEAAILALNFIKNELKKY